MRNLTEYERSRIKDAIRLSKKFSDKVMRQKIKALLKEPLRNFLIKLCVKRLKRF